jgi:teichuronic acid exporter
MTVQRAMSATLWSAIDVASRQSVYFVITVCLARMITPEEFGVVALLSMFIGLAWVLVDGGLTSALIQRQDASYIDQCTVFWLNIVTSVTVAGLLWVLAPLFAEFYGIEVIEPLTRLIALSIPIGALGSIHQTLFTKHLKFRSLMLVGFVSALFSGSVAVFLAWQGYGVWALSVQVICGSAITSIMLWIVSPWRPAFVFSLRSACSLFSFGGYILASSIVGIISGRLHTILIGKFYSLAELGYYNRAGNTTAMPGNILNDVLGRVAFPMFAETAQDKRRLKRGVSLALRSSMLLNVPVMLGVAVVAEPLIANVFGNQWLPAAPILQVLCIAGVLWPAHLINSQVLMAQGHSQLIFRLELLKKSIGIVLILAGSLNGLMGIAWSQVALSLVSFFINAHYTSRYLGYSAFDQIRDFFPIILISVIMAGAVHAVTFSVDEQLTSLALLVLQVLTGMLVFISLIWIFGLRSAKEAHNLISAREFMGQSKHLAE